MKPKMFIGSSAENIDVAYAMQENLDHTCEVTVWSQGIFELSKYTLDSLIDVLDESDFGVFVFSPDDLLIIRDEIKRKVRDNVLFELGMFVGKLGKERNYILIPLGNETVDLQTDLLGITPATYEPNRQDGNLNAALGPAANKIIKAVRKFGSREKLHSEDEVTETEVEIVLDENDKKAILASWMGSRPMSENLSIIYYQKVDKELRLEPGTTKKYIKSVATRWNYIPDHEGENTILFKEKPRQARVISSGISRW